MAVVGSGDYRHERVPSWPDMFRYLAFGATSDGAVSSRDEVHIFSRGHALCVDAHDSIYVTEIGRG